MKAKCDKNRSKVLGAGISSSGSQFDKEAVNCQYAMAESFVKSILDWECPIPREEFKDIADVILKRLGFLLEYEPVNGEDRKSQQMRFLADVIGSWISGVLFEVAEVRKTELEEECERRKKGMAEESEEESDDESQDDYPSKYDDDDDDDDKPDDGRKPGRDEDKEENKRPLSRGFRGFRLSKDKNGKDDDDKDKGQKSSKKVSGESEKVDFDDGKRKSSDDDKFYDARTGESQDIGEKKTPMKGPEVAEDRQTKDVTSEKAPGAVEFEKKGEKEPEVMKEGDERRRTDDKLEKLESLKGEALEKKEKRLETEELPVTSTKPTEKREDEIPEKVPQPRVPQEVRNIDDQDRKQSSVVGVPEASKMIDGPEAAPPGVDTSPTEVIPRSEDFSTLATLKKVIPDEKGRPEVETGVPEAGKVVAAEPDKTLSAEQSRPSKEETTKPAESEIVDPETKLILSEEKPQKKKQSNGEEERKEPEDGAIKIDDPSAKLSEIPATIVPTPEMAADTTTQLEEKLQIPRASMGEKELEQPEIDTEKVTQQVPKIDRRPELPEVSAETREMSTRKVEVPKTSVVDMKSKEIVAKDDKMLETPTLLDPAVAVAQPTPEVAVSIPEVAVSMPEVDVPTPEVALPRPEKTEKRLGMSQTAAEVPQAPKEETPAKPEVAESRPEISETRPETTPVTSESKVEELKKTSKDSTLVVPARESWDKVQPAEIDEERRRILGSLRRSSESADHFKAEFIDPKAKKELKEYPHGLVVDKKFRTDTPFVTFDKIFHTIYNAIENNEENSGDDPVTNRIHRAVYEKCSNIVQEEKPGQLSELTKDVLEVMSGKIAIWLKNILTESQMNFVDRFPATVESNEVREWTSWISFISNTADDWSNWIQSTIRQAEGLSNGPITKRVWTDWTENVDTDALKWRRFYLESVHRAHRNLTMIRDRRVVKTGTKRFHDHNDENEKEVKITDLEDEQRSSDRSS